MRLTVLAGLGVAGILAILIWKKNLATRVTFLRFVIQAVSFAAIFYIFHSTTIPLLYVLIVLLAMTLFLGRFFCGWLCPFALIMDIESLVRKALKIRHRIIPDKLNKILHKFTICHTTVFPVYYQLYLWFLEPPPNMDFAILMAQLLAGPFPPIQHTA